jgi:hypothetical protein
MGIGTRTVVQLALVGVGLLIWGYGQRIDDSRLTLVGMICFGVAAVLRFVKPREPREP